MGTEECNEFDAVTLLSPFAVGVPGKRTFFLAIGEKNKWSRIWFEKEHLKALALGIEQLLATVSKQGVKVPRTLKTPSTSDDIPSGLPSAELDIVEMALGFDEGSATLELLVQKSGAQDKDPSELCYRATLAQMKKLGALANTICAAGRPLCPKCGGPIDPTGHVCPEQNAN